MRKLHSISEYSLKGNSVSSEKKITSYDAKNPSYKQVSNSINEIPVSEAQIQALQSAYKYFNQKLFNGQLQDLYLNFNKHRYKADGYFSPKSWVLSKDASNELSEICISPQVLDNDPMDIMATLVHEMCHFKNFIETGRKTKNDYHDLNFAKTMARVGLMTSHTGEEGGKRIGRRMSHYIISDGPFENAFRAMPEEIQIPLRPKNTFFSSGVKTPETNQAKNKVAYHCPNCKNKVWGKPNLAIICGSCNVPFKLN